MMRRRLSVILLAVGAVALTIGGKAIAGQESGRPAAESAGAEWRWESYGDVQLRVPGSWAQALWTGPADCSEDDWVPEATVFRPGGMRSTALKLCPAAKPAQQVAPSVVFGGERVGVVPLAGGWIRETRKIGEQLVTVTAGDDVLRRQIFDSAGVVASVDSYGCAPRADRRVARPPAQGGLKSVGDVTGVSVCRYSIEGLPIAPTGSPEDIRFARLQASSRLSGVAADHLVRDLVAAPPGAGPEITDPHRCAPEPRPDPGHEFLILRVQGSEHAQDVIYRYDGCHDNGTDDSSVRRQLTADTARQLFVGVHQVNQSYPALDKLLIGTPPPVR
ncbi:hypothetical protein [Kribbella sp. NPDC051770]|uniref:hypothetical protein n=1 Tax=Kribbella sp. NPDC051770 TaxID=3155413 RepID=UPI00344A2F66